MKNMNQKGFTIIELMIALLLGMIIMVAVTQVYLMSMRTATNQQAGSSILDANVFGLQQVERNLRLAGLDMSHKSDSQTKLSGIITSVNNIGNDNVTLGSGFDATMVTRTSADLPTNVQKATASSDQLTIQYRAPTDILDCEGDLALGPRKAKVYDEEGELIDKLVPIEGQIVVERYFLKDDGKGNLGLWCDAGRYALEKVESYSPALTNSDQQEAHERVDAIAPRFNGKDKPTINVEGMGTGEQQIIANVDDFRLQLAIANGNNIQYITPAQYINSANNRAIIAVKAAILVRGNVPALDVDTPQGQSFVMLGDENVQLKDGVPTNYLRRVYESNSMLRNSREKK